MKCDFVAKSSATRPLLPLWPSVITALSALMPLLVGVLCAFPTTPAGAFTMTFDELGNCSSTVGVCSGAFMPDPTGTVTGNVLVFTLPTLTFTGNVNVFDPNGVTLSDHLRWIDPNNSSSACNDAPGVAACATRMILYSLDDLGGQTPTFTTMASTTEDANGKFVWNVPAPGIDIYIGFSNVPIPAALPLFASGVGVIALLVRRRKRKDAAVAA